MGKTIFLILTFFCILTYVSSCTDSDASASLPIKVMSFNIRYGTADDGENAWPNRKYYLLQVIQSTNPDILGVQEALDFQLEVITQHFPHFKKSGAGRDDGRHAGEHSAILFDSTKFDLLQEETFWFSDTPHKAGSLSWDAHFPRICSWAELKDKQSSAHLFVFNNHWDHQSQTSRQNSAQMLLDKISQLKTDNIPVIIMGDFNAGEDNPAFKTLLDNNVIKLRDSYRILHPTADSTGTFNGFKGKRDGDKIDAILVAPAFSVLTADIIHSNYDGLYPSDHFPVATTLSIK